MQTRPVVHTDSGEEIDLFNPDPKKISLDAIAKALAKTERWGRRFDGAISVAKHSCICAAVAKVVAPKDVRFQFDCLIHDAAEAYTVDVPSTAKDFVYFKEGSEYLPFDEVENRVLEAIYESFDVPFDNINHARVKSIDIAVRYAEYQVLKRQDTYTPDAHFEEINDGLTKPIGVSAVLASVTSSEFDTEKAVAQRTSISEERELYKYVATKLLDRFHGFSP